MRPFVHGVFAIALLVTATVRPSAAAPVEPRVRVVPQIGHSQVEAGTVTDDGRFAITAANDLFQNYEAKLWDVASGRLLRPLLENAGHRAYATSLGMSGDGRRAAGIVGGAAFVWNTETGEDLAPEKGFGPPVSDEIVSSPHDIWLSDDGASVIVLGDDLGRYDVVSKRLLTSYPGGSKASRIAVSANGRVLAAVLSDGSKATVGVWMVATGRVLHTVTPSDKSDVPVAHSLPAVSPDGRFLAYAAAAGTILVDLGTGRVVRRLPAQADRLFFLPDGSLGTMSEDSRSRLAVIDPTGGRPDAVRDIGGSIVGLSRNGALGVVVQAGVDDDDPAKRRPEKADIVDLVSGRSLMTVPARPPANYGIKFAADGRSVVSLSGGRLVITEESGKGGGKLAGVAQEEGNVAFAMTRDGRSILVGGDNGNVGIYPVSGGNRLRYFTGLGNVVNVIAQSDDGRLVAAGGEDGAVALWTAADSKKIYAAKGNGRSIRAIAFTPDGGRLILGTDDNRVRIIDVATRKEVFNLRMLVGPVTAMAISPDGRYVAAGSLLFDIKGWEIATGKLVAKMEAAYGGDRDHSTTAVRFVGRDSKRLWASYGNKLSLFDVSVGKEVAAFGGEGVDFEDMAVSAETGALRTVDVTGTVKVWDAATGALRLTTYTQPERIALTPEGFFDATPGAARSLAVVRGLQVYSIEQMYQQLYRPDLVAEKLRGDPKGLVKAAAERISLNTVVESGNPPVVHLAEVPATTRETRLTLRVSIEDTGGGIGRIEWRVNGVTVDVSGRSPDRDETAPTRLSSTTIERSIELVRGENRIEVLAYNGRGLVASTPAVAMVRADVTESLGKPTLWVLSVGVNDYFDSRLKLNFALPDARALAEALSSARGDIYAAVETKVLLDDQVTPARLDEAFTTIAARARPEDTFVFFAAGHGKTVDGRYYFLPRDFRYREEASIVTDGIGQDRFQAWFARIQARRSVLLFDTCESGSLTGEGIALRGFERAVAMEKMTLAMGRTTIAAATDDAPALEGYRGHGVFTYALLEAIGRADGDGDGRVDVLELIGYLDRTVPELSEKTFRQRQIPQVKFTGSNFVLAKRTDVAIGASDAPSADLRRPTHVVIRPVPVLRRPGSAEGLQTLNPGTQIVALRTEAGWVLISRSGVELGFVREDALARLQ